MKRTLQVIVVVAAGVAAFGTGCAAQRARQAKDQTICPEFRNQICVGGQDCTMDTQRGCRVCQCTSVDSSSPFTPTSDPNYIPQH